jgi:hypothetical protein
MTDLSHIYHRPGELFWLECDPFQKALPCWHPRHEQIHIQLQLGLRCVTCGITSAEYSEF